MLLVANPHASTSSTVALNESVPLPTWITGGNWPCCMHRRAKFGRARGTHRTAIRGGVLQQPSAVDSLYTGEAVLRNAPDVSKQVSALECLKAPCAIVQIYAKRTWAGPAHVRIPTCACPALLAILAEARRKYYLLCPPHMPFAPPPHPFRTTLKSISYCDPDQSQPLRREL
eukprot:scaffold38584_cov31-Tisochrysis_lutea.AAC.4